MKQDEKEENFSEEGNQEGQVYESPEDAFKKALEIGRSRTVSCRTAL